MDFTKIDYLQKGDSVQKLAFSVLNEMKIFDILSDFDPVLAGTIPIGIYTELSDLDIICQSSDFGLISNLLKENFNHFDSFQLKEKSIRNQWSLICQFQTKHFKIEIFVQNVPSTSQYAYLHMLKEYEVLEEKGEAFKKNIIQLKKQGIKTEPAFALLLNLAGDPYQALLEYGK